MEKEVSGIHELIKNGEADTIDYNDTVFAKMIQIYGGAKQIIKFMKLINKLSKKKANDKIKQLPEVYRKFYEYIIERFITNYKTTSAGKVLVGGNIATSNFDQIFNDIKSIDLYSEMSTNNLGEHEFGFMKSAHKNYLNFKQSGGNINVRDTMFITNMDKTAHCEKYAKLDEHPVCKQFLSDIKEFKTYLRNKMKNT